MKKYTLSILLVSVVLGGTCGFGISPAQAESTDARLSRIERDIDTLSRSVYRGEKPGRALSSGVAAAQEMQNQFEARISQIEQDIRNLTNTSEEQGNALTQMNRSLMDIVNRLSLLEQKINMSNIVPSAGTVTAPSPATGISAPTSLLPNLNPNGTAPVTSPTVQTMGTLTSPHPSVMEPAVSTGDPTFMYENALELLKQRDYELAEKSLNDFLVQNPNHTLTPNARYWLGETYFVQNKFDAAARIFAEGYQKYPKGAKAADNLLKLGLSLAATQKIPDACVALKQIAKDFPNGATAVKVRATSEIKKLKCGS